MMKLIIVLLAFISSSAWAQQKTATVKVGTNVNQIGQIDFERSNDDYYVEKIQVGDDVAYVLSSVGYKGPLESRKRDDMVIKVGSTYENWSEKVISQFNLPSDALVVISKGDYLLNDLENVSGKVKVCTKYHSTGWGTSSYETLCVKKYLVGVTGFKDLIGERIKVKLYDNGLGNAPCDIFASMRHPFGCKLRNTYFIASYELKGELIKLYSEDGIDLK